MDPITAGALITGVFGVGNRMMAGNQQQASQRLAMQNWIKQQEYNLPKNQMSRLADAGINPHLAFSSGNINNTASSAPQTFGQSPVNLDPSALQSGLLMEKTQAEIDNTIARTAVEKWKKANESQKYAMNQMIAEIEQSKFKRKPDGTMRTEAEKIQYLSEYANQLRQAELSEMQARELLSNMDSELSKNNLTRNTSPVYTLISKFFKEYFGWNMETTNN